MKAIREHSPVTFEYLMKGDKAWLFNLLMIELAVMAVASVAYFLHKMNFAKKPMPTLRGLTLGALGFMMILTVLLMIPADASLVPRIGLVFLEGKETSIPLGAMYPWKYIGLIGMMLVGVFAVALYLKASASGFHWGRASRWSQYALLAAAVTVVFTMMTMGYARESGRRAGEAENWLIRECITFDQQVVGEGCPAAPKDNP
jgi:cytochrome d ubiquinol oxidase subunit I